MSHDLIEQRLREQAAGLPEPDPQTALLARRALVASAGLAPANPAQGERRALLLLAGALVAVAIAFGGGYGVGAAGAGDRNTLTAPDGWRRLGVGVSVDVPPEWSGRVLFLDSTGLYGSVLQVANFDLPENEGFEPSAELPPGEDDPIKAMGAQDVLITLETSAGPGARAPSTISLADLETLPRGAPNVPLGHMLAKKTFCFDHRCLAITVDFGENRPSADLRERVDGVLSSIAVDPE